MAEGQDVERITLHAVHKYVGRMHDEFAGTRHASRPTDHRLGGQGLCHKQQDTITQPYGGLRVISADPFGYISNVTKRLWRPVRDHARIGLGCGSG